MGLADGHSFHFRFGMWPTRLPRSRMNSAANMRSLTSRRTSRPMDITARSKSWLTIARISGCERAAATTLRISKAHKDPGAPGVHLFRGWNRSADAGIFRHATAEKVRDQE